LVWAVEFRIHAYENFEGSSSVRKAAIPRSLGARHALCIDRLIAATTHVNWRRMENADKEKFKSELVWVRDLMKGDIKEIYRQSKIYRTLEDDRYAHRLFVTLRLWAMDKHLPEAEYDRIQDGFSEDNDSVNGIMLSNMAYQGYLPAMQDAARRFLNGDGVQRNRGKAYFWLKRAQFAGGDVSSILKTPHERLFLDMGASEWSSLISNIYEYFFRIFEYGYKDLKTWASRVRED